MPLIEIRLKSSVNLSAIVVDLRRSLPPLAAGALSCVEGGILTPDAIMVEFSDATSDDTNCKDAHVRVWAHDYPSRRKNLKMIRQKIAEEVVKHLPAGTSWYVWVLLAITSYGSDTEED
jgi:hypothetical protein